MYMFLGTASMGDSNEGSGMGRQAGEGKEKQFQVERPVQGMDRILTQYHTPCSTCMWWGGTSGWEERREGEEEGKRAKG